MKGESSLTIEELRKRVASQKEAVVQSMLVASISNGVTGAALGFLLGRFTEWSPLWSASIYAGTAALISHHALMTDLQLSGYATNSQNLEVQQELSVRADDFDVDCDGMVQEPEVKSERYYQGCDSKRLKALLKSYGLSLVFGFSGMFLSSNHFRDLVQNERASYLPEISAYQPPER